MSNVNVVSFPGSVMLHPDITVMEVIHMKPVRNCGGKKEFLYRKLAFLAENKVSSQFWPTR